MLYHTKKGGTTIWLKMFYAVLTTATIGKMEINAAQTKFMLSAKQVNQLIQVRKQIAKPLFLAAKESGSFDSRFPF